MAFVFKRQFTTLDGGSSMKLSADDAARAYAGRAEVLHFLKNGNEEALLFMPRQLQGGSFD